MDSTSSDLVRFGDRLREVLAKRGEHATQAWLAERSGVDRSLISRMVGNERVPTLETLEALAPALEVDIAQLVAGTNAETRLAEGAEHVRRSDYQEAIGKVIQYETKIHDLEAQVRSLAENLEKEHLARRSAISDRTVAETERDEANAALAELRKRFGVQKAELDKYKAALQRALTQFSALKARVDDLQKELGETKQSSRASAILSGVAALAGVATVAYFLGGEDSTKSSGSQAKKTGGTK